MTVARIDDHGPQALGRLLQQSRGKPNFIALLNSMTAVVQGFEGQAYEVLRGRELGQATGAQLDGVGQLVGQARPDGTADDQYRLLLLGRIYANNSDSTTPTVIALATALFGAETVQVVSELSPGFAHRQAPGALGIEIGSPKLPRALWQQAISVLRDSLAAAVRLSWVSVFDAGASFALDGPLSGAGMDGASITYGMAELIFDEQGA